MSAVHLVRPDEGIVGPLRILAGGAETGGRYFALEWETKPSPPDPDSFHSHEDQDESEFVLTGEREISCGAEQWRGGRGLFVIAPPRTRHTMRTLGNESSRWLHFFSPAGLERFFVEREWMRAAGKSPMEIAAVAERYGTRSLPTRAPEAAPMASLPAEDASRRVVVAGDLTRGAYALVEMASLPEQPHTHDQDEAFYVMDGELTIELNGERIVAPARSFVLVPRGLKRRHRAGRSGRLLAVFSSATPGH
ncbi:MAG TPA: cupin domain-containing protein [Candidatus Limnocylindria bacterium]|jgi:quercetin dioxygenase-like cupin family protein|nr:cupin domain-containing protein [Candidatus Limnocylindria bacterium]